MTDLEFYIFILGAVALFAALLILWFSNTGMRSFWETRDRIYRREHMDEHEAMTLPDTDDRKTGEKLKWMSNAEIVHYVLTVADVGSLEHELALRLANQMDRMMGR